MIMLSKLPGKEEVRLSDSLDSLVADSQQTQYSSNWQKSNSQTTNDNR